MIKKLNEKAMIEYFSKILEPIQIKLESIDLEGCDISIEESVDMINFLENCLFQLRTDFLSLKNISTKDEIQFFKDIKPYHHLLFYL
jgi:hypothetical protein